MELESTVYVDRFQEGNVYEVNNLYETSFPKLTDQYFKVRTTIKESDFMTSFDLAKSPSGIPMARG